MVGTFFVPSLSCAAGGAGMAIGASVTGLGIAFLPTVFFSGLAGMSESASLKLLFGACAVASAVASISIGAAIFGLSLPEVLPCIVLGVGIAGLGALIVAGLGSLALDGIAEGLNATFTPS